MDSFKTNLISNIQPTAAAKPFDFSENLNVRSKKENSDLKNTEIFIESLISEESLDDQNNIGSPIKTLKQQSPVKNNRGSQLNSANKVERLRLSQKKPCQKPPKDTSDKKTPNK